MHGGISESGQCGFFNATLQCACKMRQLPLLLNSGGALCKLKLLIVPTGCGCYIVELDHT